MEFYNRKAVTQNLKDFCHMAQDDDYIEITAWKNGEGIDVQIGTSNKDQSIALTYGQLKAIHTLSNVLLHRTEQSSK